MAEPSNTRLIVFSDDWGRHPSSCQHLIRRLLARYPTLWVNTIGTRMPGLSLEDLGKAVKKLRQWILPGDRGGAAQVLPANLTVIGPRMWPGFRTPRQRRFNARMIAKAVHRVLGPRTPGERRIAITTIPITADLVGPPTQDRLASVGNAGLDVDDWVYYCVDDFSVWPGLDAGVMRSMEAEQVTRVHRLVAVSDTLVTHLSAMGRKAELLTHGIDLSHWTRGSTPTGKSRPLPDSWRSLARPIYLFWGVVDARLDTAWCRALASHVAGTGGGTVMLVGPQQSPDPELARLASEGGVVRMPGPASYDDLPAMAAAADALVMPYADLPVTRAMQPLKFKEYLASGRPAIVRELPATKGWEDCADVTRTAEEFVKACTHRAAHGVDESQTAARSSRLASESWDTKAEQFEKTILRLTRD